MSDIAENMSNLSVQDNDSGATSGDSRRSYVPPHVRGQQRSGSGNYRGRSDNFGGNERSFFGNERRGGGYSRGCLLYTSRCV